MKIAQVVITKTQNEKWKITAMSLQQTEREQFFENPDYMLEKLEVWMSAYTWEQLTLDV